MARDPRTILEDMTYHTMSRCIEARDMMSLIELKNLFVEAINQAMTKYAFELNGYAILDNHFHLVIHTLDNEASISRIMQYIKARFAEKYNRKLGRIGPVWNERYKDIIIELADNPKHYFFYLQWYIGFNPVRKRMVWDPRDYYFCGINAYLDENYISPVKITRHKYYNLLGDTFMERVEKFLYYEEIYRKRMFSILF